MRAEICSRHHNDVANGSDNRVRRECRNVSRSSSGNIKKGIDRDSLYREFDPLVRKLIRKYSNSPEMGRDMVSEAYHRFSIILEEFDPSRGIPLKGYIVRKLTASMYTYSRSCWSNQIREESLDAYSGFAETISIEDPTDDWIRQIESEMLMRNIESAMGSISSRQRTALVWRYMNGMSFEEIAARLQVQPATARSLVRHALNSIRTTLDKPTKVTSGRIR